MQLINKLKSSFLGGSIRSQKAKKNILLSFVFKGFSVFAVFLLVPMSINYLNVLEYGIWVTISSLLAWLTLFDLGLGNGLRNKLAESLAKDDKELGRIYVSTAYFALTIIVSIFLIIYFSLGIFIDWSSVFNTPAELKPEVNKLANFVMLFFGLQFVLKLIITILTADQKPSYNDFLGFLTNISSVIIVWILTHNTSPSLFVLGMSLSIIPVILLLLITVFNFSNRYRFLIPSPKFIHIKYLRGLSDLGIRFFIIQISTFFIFGSASIVLTQLIGPESVTSYNIVFRYFSIINMVFYIILSPVWTGFTDAFYRKDFSWIKNTIKKLNKIGIILIIFTIIMVLVSGFIYDIWLGKNRSFDIPFLLTTTMGLYVIAMTFVSPYMYFLNGSGKIYLQFILSIIIIISYIPLTIFLLKVFNFGVASVVIASIISLVPFMLLMPIQYYKIINDRAKSFWNK
ncbi:MAG: oligosaccharide flippase family protein [Ignavibacteria bacterium]